MASYSSFPEHSMCTQDFISFLMLFPLPDFLGEEYRPPHKTKFLYPFFTRSTHNLLIPPEGRVMLSSGHIQHERQRAALVLYLTEVSH